jgi:hypothetical protein
MGPQVLLVTVLGTIHTVVAMDWGAMNQYNTTLVRYIRRMVVFITNVSQERPPQPSGNTIWISGKEGDGFDIVLSPDAQAKVEGILEGCGTAEDTCYQEVLKSLRAADLELDSQIERRSLGALLSKTAKGAWDIIFDIGTMLWLNWKIKADKMDNSAFHLPLSKAEEAASSASASSVVHSAGASVVLTITPTPISPSLTG